MVGYKLPERGKMDAIIAITNQVLPIAGAVLASGVLTSVLTEVLKLPFIIIPASKYPKTTAGVLAVIISGGAILALDALTFSTWVDWAVLAVASLLVAVKSYDWILKGVYEKISKSN